MKSISSQDTNSKNSRLELKIQRQTVFLRVQIYSPFVKRVFFADKFKPSRAHGLYLIKR